MNKYIKIIAWLVGVFVIILIINTVVSSIFEDGANEIIREISIKNDLERSTEKLAESLPFQVDENTTLVQMEYLKPENKVVSTYQVNGISNAQVLNNLVNFKERMLNFISNDTSGRNAMSIKASFEYHYKDSANNIITKIIITPEDY
jgi:predicted PurR-regulated permease PerM